MSAPVRITAEAPGPDEIERLYAAAFPQEALSALVLALLALDEGVISLAARAPDAIAGHALFTLCAVEDGGTAALLGPLAVAPDRQRQGLGGALIQAGLTALEATPASHVLVLGDPTYYERFGFAPERTITPAHPIPARWSNAWRSITLKPVRAAGRLMPPSPWDDPALWG